MYKKIVLLLVSCLLLVSLSACGQKKEVTMTPEAIEQKFADALGTEHYLCDTNIEKDKFFQTYGLDEKEVESYVAKENKNPGENPDRVAIVKVKQDYTETAVELFNKAYSDIVETVRKSSSNLGKTLNACIYKQDNYVAFFLTGAAYDGDSSEEELKIAKKDYETIQNTWKEIFGDTPSNLAIVPPDK